MPSQKLSLQIFGMTQLKPPAFNLKTVLLKKWGVVSKGLHVPVWKKEWFTLAFEFVFFNKLTNGEGSKMVEW